jgi:hypothetical protein
MRFVVTKEWRNLPGGGRRCYYAVWDCVDKRIVGDLHLTETDALDDAEKRDEGVDAI